MAAARSAAVSDLDGIGADATPASATILPLEGLISKGMALQLKGYLRQLQQPWSQHFYDEPHKRRAWNARREDSQRVG